MEENVAQNNECSSFIKEYQPRIYTCIFQTLSIGINPAEATKTQEREDLEKKHI